MYVDKFLTCIIILILLTMNGFVKNLSRIDLGRNVALKQPTWQSSDYTVNGVKYDSTRAVDGITSGNLVLDQSCTHTAPNTPGSWMVSFTQPMYLSRYVLYNRGKGLFISRINLLIEY